MMINSMNFAGFYVPRHGFAGFASATASPASGMAPC